MNLCEKITFSFVQQDTDNMLSNLLKKECVNYIIEHLVRIVKIRNGKPVKSKLKTSSNCTDEEFKYDPQTFISIEYPYSIIDTSRFPRTKIKAEWLLSRAGLKKQKDQQGFTNTKWLNESEFWLDFDWEYETYYEHSFEREIMRIILSNEKVSQYFDLKVNCNDANCNDDEHKHGKNLLMLDWDQTLYCNNLKRPHLMEFLKCATKYCVIFINTWGCEKERKIHKLNKKEGIHISGVFNLSRRKDMFNRWIKNFHWCNIDEKHFNFLLIDDRNERCTNFLQVPRFSGNSNDDVLLKLIPWIKQWHRYTSIDKQGTTNQFIKTNPISFQ